MLLVYGTLPLFLLGNRQRSFSPTYLLLMAARLSLATCSRCALRTCDDWHVAHAAEQLANNRCEMAGLNASNDYLFRECAVNKVGQSAYSPVSGAVPRGVTRRGPDCSGFLHLRVAGKRPRRIARRRRCERLCTRRRDGCGAAPSTSVPR